MSASSSGWLEDRTLVRGARECRLFLGLGEMKEARGLRLYLPRLPPVPAAVSKAMMRGLPVISGVLAAAEVASR